VLAEWRHDCSSSWADGFPLLWGHKNVRLLLSVLSVYLSLYFVFPPAHRKAVSFFAFDSIPPKSSQRSESQQTNSLTGRDAWGRWDICWEWELCCMHLCFTYMGSLRVQFGWWHPVDGVCGGLFWKTSNSCRINALKVAIYNIAAALFQMQVIVAWFGGGMLHTTYAYGR